LKFIKKKPTFVIKYDRWKDKMLKSEEKYTSITIIGAYKAFFVFIYILSLLFFNLLASKYMISLKDVLFLIVVLFIVPLFEGYLDYKRYSFKNKK
jgi:phosphatidylglycerophosphate synthase